VSDSRTVRIRLTGRVQGVSFRDWMQSEARILGLTGWVVDFTCYVVLLAHHGAAARLTVTTGLHISFLRKAGLEDVICETELLKHGRTLSVADCRITTADGRLIAHAEATHFMAGASDG
jgi:acyl-coenzyme A thioesterase PaaI-like protein